LEGFAECGEKKTCFSADQRSYKKAGSNIDELNNQSSAGPDRNWMVFHRPFNFKPGLGGTQVCRKKRVVWKRKISWLTLDFAWLSMDIGNSLWTVNLWILDSQVAYSRQSTYTKCIIFRYPDL